MESLIDLIIILILTGIVVLLVQFSTVLDKILKDINELKDENET